MTTSKRILNERLNNLEEDTVGQQVKQVNESPMQKSSEQFKCDKCNYTGKTSASLNKHTSTKHVHEDIEYFNKEESECVSDCFNDWFQMEFVEGEQVYACNVCSKCFDKSDKIKRHIEKEHKDVQISKDIHEKDESELNSISNDESYGAAWLAKYDSDGNFMGY